MLTVVQPPNFTNGNPGQVVYLEGPILGATDWQSESLEYFSRRVRDVIIAIPRRKGPVLEELPEDEHRRQIRWQEHFLLQAWKHGIVLFWLPKESEHICSRPYAQSSRLILGRTIERYRTHQNRFVIGMEPDFPGERNIRFQLCQNCPEIAVRSSLEMVCNDAIAMLTGCFRSPFHKTG